MKKKILALILCLAVCIAPVGFASAEELASPQTRPSSEVMETDPGIEVGELILEEELELSDLPDASTLLMDEEESNESASEITEVSDLYNIKPMPNFQSTRAATAALPDISLGAIVIRGDQPYPSNANTKVEVGLNNIGSASATNVVVSLYLDGTLKGKFMIEGTLNPGDSGTFYCTANILGGTHTLKMIANEDRTITESNYTNNTKETTRTWADCIALSADHVRPQDGSSQCVSREVKMVECVFTNRGNITAEQVSVKFFVGTAQIIKQFNVDIPPRKQLIYTLPITFNASGDYTITMNVSATSPQKDITSGNDVKGYKFHVNFDMEVFEGRWDNTRNIEVQIRDDIVELANDPNFHLSMKEIQSAITAWNGYNSRVSFSKNFDTNYTHEDLGKQAMLKTGAIFGVNALGVTNHYDSDGNLYTEEVEGDIYARAEVVLDDNRIVNYGSATQSQTITHEFGHLIGLSHTLCNDASIMRATDATASYKIQPHDIYNVQNLY